MGTIVIVGSGLAGYTVAKELRKHAPELPLHIVTRDSGAFYSKPMLSNALAKGKTAETLPTATAEQMAAQLHATVWTGAEVTVIDTAARAVIARGATLAYDKLVLALGAEPIRPPLEGDGTAAVCSVNNLADYARFREQLEDAQRVAVIGSGLIGCEFANDLVQAGKQVTVIGPSSAPLDRLLPPAAGRALQEALAALGVVWHLNATVRRVERRGGAFELQLSDGATAEADAILSAVGLRPNIALAQAAGIKVKRGIAVDRYLESSAPDVFALGDCAEVEGLVLPFVMPIMQAARALARTLAGMRTAAVYPAMPVVVKTPAHAVVVAPPPPGVEGEWRVEIEREGVHALYRDGQGKLLGFALTGTAIARKQILSKELPPWLE